MKTSLPLFAVAITALIALSTHSALAQRLTLVNNGKTAYSIVLAPNSAPALRHGAEELKRSIKEMSGAELPIVEESRGAKPLRRAIRIETDPRLGEEELRIRTDGQSLRITGGGKRGAMYGCYALLEDVLGCRWYNARVHRIPRRKTISIGKLDLRQKPAFEYREPYYTEAFERDWAVRNRVNGNAQKLDEMVGGKVAYGPFVHTFNDLVPPDTYFQAHPEYFSMVNGNRMKGYYQLCLTNPDVLRISIERVKQWIKDRPDATIFSVSQNDTYGRCECPACKAVENEEGAPMGPVLRFVNAVAEAVEKEHPKVLIDTLAYQWTEDPPRLVRPRPNVRIRLAPIGACFAHGMDRCDANKKPFANLESWGRITNQLYIWHYSTNFANYLQPIPDLDEIAVDTPLFRKNGAVGIFYEGDYAPGGGGEMSELKAYLNAKQMWDTTRDPKAIIDEYVRNVYGPAAPQVREWLDLLHRPARTRNVHARIYDPPTAPYLDSETIAAGTRLFDSAEKSAAANPSALEQVQRARLAIEYVQLMQAKPDSPDRAQVAKTVADKIRKYGIGQVREGEDVSRFLQRIGQ